MKTRKLLQVLALVVILLVGTVLVASAADKIRLTGGINNTYFGMGWEWINANVLLDPVTHDAGGKIQYMAYEDSVGRDVKFSWRGEPVCGALGEIDGVPTIAVVIKILEQKNIDPSWVGKYAKTTMSDGGQNASVDMLGIVVWDFQNNSPVTVQPSCDFAEPLIMYPSLNGNLTIHD